MLATHCALFVALKNFPEDPELEKAKKHLEAAVYLSEEYHKICWSIFWNTSTERTKKRIREKCNNLAFDCYSQMLDIAEEIKAYTANKNTNQLSKAKELRELMFDLRLAFDWIEREHPTEIKYKQLSLF
ncbi:hypothetical protein BV378_20315 [Nostoc sp. RF31YmG]|jgi:hypothetical protein|nr:hypothetical protein BV378_20315 [Nostoc sp. RF31YmG]